MPVTAQLPEAESVPAILLSGTQFISEFVLSIQEVAYPGSIVCSCFQGPHRYFWMTELGDTGLTGRGCICAWVTSYLMSTVEEQMENWNVILMLEVPNIWLHKTFLCQHYRSELTWLLMNWSVRLGKIIHFKTSIFNSTVVLIQRNFLPLHDFLMSFPIFISYSSSVLIVSFL